MEVAEDSFVYYDDGFTNTVNNDVKRISGGKCLEQYNFTEFDKS